MFRPADDQMERMAAYGMQRGVVHDMGAMLRLEEQQAFMMQMREMEMMQMQAMGCVPSHAGDPWASPLEQLQPMEQESPSQQQRSTGSCTNTYACENATATTPGSSAPPRSATKPESIGAATSTSPSTINARCGVGRSDASPQPGDPSAYAPNSLYRTMSSAANVKEPPAAQESMYNGSSMYAGNTSACAPPLMGGGLNENGASTAGYSMCEANNGSSMYEQPAPSSDAVVSGPTKSAPATDALAAGSSSKAATPLPLRKTSGAGVSPTLQRKPSVSALEKKGSLASMSRDDKTSISSHRSREIRRKSSELKRQSRSGTANIGPRSPSIRSSSAEKKPSSPADKNKQSSSSSIKDKSNHRSSSSSSAKDNDKKPH
ncbi:hypothetical protein GH5_01557 [Leishmania sp. Ghana 2012 LV757]|uniref:hypothetical protein n=1 Tax=Leishmania sp. Ghana 2012 LV757 TaxID=2803181 RepID=UPI001B3F077B|nr:hypothetical protein GH5_01557 [Leishmania sp. Ghana 2012 LV757]